MHEELIVVVLLLGSSQFLPGCRPNYNSSKFCVRPMGNVKHAFLVTVEWLKVLFVAVLFDQDAEQCVSLCID
jgi:hypothetical protein